MRCAFCHGPLDAGQTCPGCGTRLHADCWAQAQGCPTLGCGRPAAPAAKAPPRWRRAVAALVTCPGLLALAVAIVVIRFGATEVMTVDPVLELHGQDGNCDRVAFTPEGDLVVAQFDHTVSVWTVPGGERVGSFWMLQEPREPIDTFALAPDGRTLAIGCTLHAIPSGEVVGTLRVPCLAWSPDGALVAGIDSATFVIADREGEWVRVMDAPPLPQGPRLRAAAVFSPDGARLAVMSRDALFVFDVATGGLLGSHASDGTWCPVAPVFVDDARTVLSFGGTGILTMPADGSRPPTRAPPTPVTSMGRPYVGAGAVSPDGTLIATGSLYGDVRLWTRFGARVDSFRPGQMVVQDLAFSRDRRWLASAHLENVVRVWRLRP